MAFCIFKTPVHWTEWLVAAIKAEKIFLERDCGKEEARNYLSKQDPKRVAEFANYFKFLKGNSESAFVIRDPYELMGEGRKERLRSVRLSDF